MMGTAWGWETVLTVILPEIQDKINKDLTLALLKKNQNKIEKTPQSF